MIVKNPTNNRIEVRIQGVDYVVEANDEIKGVPAAHADYWVSMLHSFLIVEAEKKDADITLKSYKANEEKKEAEVEEKEEVLEETSVPTAMVEEEPVVEEPKKRGRQPKNK